jgi:hypothetical protein
MALTLVKSNGIQRTDADNASHHLVKKLSWLFRCWHRKMSRPFTRDGLTFCVCVRCGMRRNFDLDAWKMTGSYYYGQVLSGHRERVITKGRTQ